MCANNYEKPYKQDEEPDQEQEETSTVSSLALAKLHRPEWGLMVAGGLASFTIGATMPAFAFLFSKLYGVSSDSVSTR